MHCRRLFLSLVVSSLAASSAFAAELPKVRTALFVGTGARSNGCAEWVRLLSSAPEIEVTFVDEKMILEGALSGKDMFVLPGGDSRTIRKAIGAGAAKIREFVINGGGYVGTCAGCCLALDEKADPERGMGLIPYRRLAHKGHAMMPLAFNEVGAKALGIKAGVQEVRYSQGPILERLAPAREDMLIETWGTYAGDIVDEKVDIAMKGHPAVVGGTLGKGRVFAITCHPESFFSTREIIRGALSYVAGREITFPVRPRKSCALVVGYFTPVMTGVESARTLQALNAMPEVDLFPIAADEIKCSMLEHVDVLILPDGVKAWYEKHSPLLKAGITPFVQRGGRVIGWGVGTGFLPPQGKPCANSAEILNSIQDRR